MMDATPEATFPQISLLFGLCLAETISPQIVGEMRDATKTDYTEWTEHDGATPGSRTRDSYSDTDEK